VHEGARESQVTLWNAPACPRIGCTTKQLTVEGSKAFVPPPLLEIMAQRIRERQIPRFDRIYCPYPKCSASMSLSEVQGSCSSKYNHGGRTCKDAALRKCARCGGSLCIRGKVPWHERMSCREYQWRYPHGGREDAGLQKLAKQRLWRQCRRCKHMIELSMGCPPRDLQVSRPLSSLILVALLRTPYMDR
jgi:hypothetical protein